MPPIDSKEAVPVRLEPSPLKPVAVITPVDGLNLSLVDDTFSPLTVPVVAVTNVMYRVAFVVVSSVMLIADVGVCQDGTPLDSVKTCPFVPAESIVVVPDAD